jgi:putative addiction module antidote
MSTAVKKISKHGNSATVSMSRSDLQDLAADPGDSVAIEHRENGVFITAYDNDFSRKVEAIERSRRKFRNAYRELAK